MPAMSAMRLEGRVALVTGASRGIGAAVAKLFAAQGAHVVALARTVGGLEELDDAIKAAGGAATLVPQDLADLDAIDRLGAALHERFGKLDILVANAGVLGVLAGVVGALQATEAIKFILGLGNLLTDRLMVPLSIGPDRGPLQLVSGRQPGDVESGGGRDGVSRFQIGNDA